MIAFLFLLGVEWDGGSIIILSTIVIEEIRALPHFAPSPGHAHGDESLVASLKSHHTLPHAACLLLLAPSAARPHEHGDHLNVIGPHAGQLLHTGGKLVSPTTYPWYGVFDRSLKY
jgi:hypothetical protein